MNPTQPPDPAPITRLRPRRGRVAYIYGADLAEQIRADLITHAMSRSVTPASTDRDR